MPLPLIVPVLIGAAGLFGVGKGIKAAVDNSEADELNTRARNDVSQWNRQLDHSREATNKSLETVGREKARALLETLPDFLDTFGKLKNVEPIDGSIDGLTLGSFGQAQVADMRRSCSLMEASAIGLGTGATGGALAAFGAYSSTMMLASAGTGTAISALSGAAATNATLAWLGGGTLASGGLGIAGGTMVLGALAAGPALLVFGTFLGMKASANLSNARSNIELAKTHVEEIRNVLVRLEAIYDLATISSNALQAAIDSCASLTAQVKHLIEYDGVDYRSYSASAKSTVMKAVKSAQLLKLLVDASILNETGAVSDEGGAAIRSIAKHLNVGTEVETEAVLPLPSAMPATPVPMI